MGGTPSAWTAAAACCPRQACGENKAQNHAKPSTPRVVRIRGSFDGGKVRQDRPPRGIDEDILAGPAAAGNDSAPAGVYSDEYPAQAASFWTDASKNHLASGAD